MLSDDQLAETERARGSVLLLPIWLLWSAVMLAFSLRQGNGLMLDPDDFMRMAQAKDLMAGQSWFDVTQYRLNPPEGGSMHWSRLFDVPIASLIGLLQLFVSQPMAERLTIIILPMLLLGLLMWFVFRTVDLLAGNRIALVAAFLLPSYPLIVCQFLPGRIDHHGWQIIMAAMAMLAVFDRNPLRGALTLAFAMSVWMHISIEGLPYVVMFGGMLAVSYLFPVAITGKLEDVRLIPYASGLVFFSAILFGATQASNSWFISRCDAVSWPLLTVLACVAAVVGVGHHVIRPKKLSAKMLMLSVAGLSGAALFMFASDSCALDPFGNLSPLVREYWYDKILEGLPITRQSAPVVSLLLFVPVLATIWMAIVWRDEQDEMRKKRWLILFMLIIAATLLSFKVQRTAGVAEVFALPAIAALTSLLVQRLTASANIIVRVFGSTVIVIALTPMSAFFVGNALFAAPADAMPAATDDSNRRPCNLTELNRLPKGLIFTTMAAGPEILYQTRHSVYVSGYHRNHKAMDRLINIMVGPADQARPMLEAAKIDYVMVCPDHFEAQSYIKNGRQNFTSSLMSAAPPPWLRPVEAFADSRMRVFRYLPKMAR